MRRFLVPIVAERGSPRRGRRIALLLTAAVLVLAFAGAYLFARFGARLARDPGLTSRNASFNPATGVFTCTSGARMPGATPGSTVPATTTDVSRLACAFGCDKKFTGWSCWGGNAAHTGAPVEPAKR